MRRREFITLLMSTSAAVALQPPGLSWAQASAPAPPLTVNVTSKFMQDYTDGQMIAETLAREIPYLAADGTMNIYNPVLFGPEGSIASLERIAEVPTSITGWQAERSVFLPPPPASFGETGSVPRKVLVSPLNGRDRLLVYREHTVQAIPLYAGSYDLNGITTRYAGPNPSYRAIPLTRGKLAPEPRYIPELRVSGEGTPEESVWFVLRSVDNLDQTLEPAGASVSNGGVVDPPILIRRMPVGKQLQPRRIVFPMRDASPNFFHYVALEEDSTVAYVTLGAAPSGQGGWKVRTRTSLGSAESGSVVVREVTPGAVEVLILDLGPRTGGNDPRVAAGAVRSIAGSYSAGQAVSWSAAVSAPVPQPPSFPAGTQFDMRGLTNPATQATELYVIALRPDSGCSGDVLANPEFATAPGCTPHIDTWVYTRPTGQTWQQPRVLDRSSRLAVFAGEGLPAMLVPNQADILAPTALVSPAGDQDRLLVYRQNTVQVIPLAANGSFDPTSAISHWAGYHDGFRAIPLTRGKLPPEPRYIPELRVFGEGDTTVEHLDFVLRSVDNLDQIEVPSGNSEKNYADPPLYIRQMPIGRQLEPRRIVFPMRDASPDFFHYVALEEGGGVRYVSLWKPPNYPFAFKTKTVVGLAAAESGCIVVREDTPGTVEVLILDITARTGGANPQVFLGGVRSITGHYTPGQDVSWSDPVISAIPEPLAFPDGTQFDMRVITNRANQATELYVSALRPDAACTDDVLTRPGFATAPACTPHIETWLLARRPNQSWQPPLLLDKGSRLVGVFAGEDVPTVLVHNEADGFSAWRLLESGEYTQEIIQTPPPTGAELGDAACYRVGILLRRDKVPVGGEKITIRATSTCLAVVNGTRVLLAPRRAVESYTDATGNLWVTVVATNRLMLPTLTVSSARIGGNLRIDLHQKIQTFLRSVTDQQLAGATDPRSGQKVVPNPANAPAAAQAFRDLLSSAAANPSGPPRPMAAAPAGPPVESDLPVSWVPDARLEDASAGAIAERTGNFRLFFQNGTLQYQTLSDADAERLANDHAAARAAQMAAPMAALIKWPWEYLEDAYHYVKDKVEEVAELIFQGSKVLLKLVIDGITHAYDFVMDTVERVFEAVDWVMHQAGILYGRLAGWLLDLLGFLFPWKQIKAERTRLKERIRSQAASVTTRIANPQTKFRSIADGLDSARQATIGTLNSFKTSAPNTTTFGTWSVQVPSLPEILSKGSESFLSEGTWMLEKVMAVLPGTSFTPGVPDFLAGSTVFDTLATRLFAAATALAPSLADLNTLLSSWVGDGTLFSSAAFNPVLDIIIARIDTLFDALKDVAQAMADMMSSLWNNMPQMVAWLDQEISPGFIGGFYEGLTDNSLTALDLVCLLAGTVSVLGGLNSSAGISMAGGGARRPIAMTAQDDLDTDAFIFAVIGTVTTALSATWTAGSESEDEANFGKAIGYVDLAMTVCTTMLRAAGHDKEWEFYTMLGVLGFVGVAGLGYKAGIWAKKWPGPKPSAVDELITAGTLMLYFMHSLRAALAFADSHNFNDCVVDIISTVQNFATVFMRLGRPLEPDPWAPIGFGAFQGSLSGVKAWLIWKRPI
jgi:hypothetical protein